MDNIIPWGIAALIAVALFRAGVTFSNDERTRKVEAQRQRDLDLGLLAPVLAQLSSGELSREEADAEVRRTAFFQRSAETLWFTMSEHERSELGARAAEMYHDPIFLARQAQLLDELKAEDPDLFQQVKGAVREQEDRHGPADETGEVSELVRDLIGLKETDPEGYREALEVLLRRAAEPT